MENFFFQRTSNMDYNPEGLAIFVTKACPGRCNLSGLGKTCGISEKTFPKFDDISPDDAAMLTEIGIRLGFTSTCLTGGEAVYQPYVLKAVAKKISSYNKNDHSLAMTTSLGFLLDDEICKSFSEINKIYPIELIGSVDKIHDNFYRDTLTLIRDKIGSFGLNLKRIKSIYTTPEEENKYLVLKKFFRCYVETIKLGLVGKAYESVLESRPPFVTEVDVSGWVGESCDIRESHELFVGVKGDDFVFYPKSCFGLSKYLELGRINRSQMTNMGVEERVSEVKKVIGNFRNNKVINYLTSNDMGVVATEQCPDLKFLTINPISECEICYQVFHKLNQLNKELRLL